MNIPKEEIISDPIIKKYILKIIGLTNTKKD
jgi:hypothetical protein